MPHVHGFPQAFLLTAIDTYQTNLACLIQLLANQTGLQQIGSIQILQHQLHNRVWNTDDNTFLPIFSMASYRQRSKFQSYRGDHTRHRISKKFRKWGSVWTKLQAIRGHTTATEPKARSI